MTLLIETARSAANAPVVQSVEQQICNLQIAVRVRTGALTTLI